MQIATTVVAVQCRMCHEVHFIDVPIDGFVAWQSGELIQDALPELSADQRELLISGTCGMCWDDMFGSSDEDE